MASGWAFQHLTVDENRVDWVLSRAGRSKALFCTVVGNQGDATRLSAIPRFPIAVNDALQEGGGIAIFSASRIVRAFLRQSAFRWFPTPEF
jgi:hypothetical protein